MANHQETALTAQIIHAFTGHSFCGKSAKGNPAAVVFLNRWPSADVLLRVSQILAQPVTAFLVKRTEGYDIRWFSLDAEINLCGHGSLAAAACIFETEVLDAADKHSVSLFSRHGTVVIHRDKDDYSMRMPAWQAVRHEQNWRDAKHLGLSPVDVFATRDLVIVLDNAQQVFDYRPDFTQMKNLGNHHAVILTAPQGNRGYVLRNFAPKIGIDEDIATGSAQCSLAPYWLEKLGQTHLDVHQLSVEGGYFNVGKADDGIMLTVQVEKAQSVCVPVNAELTI